MLHRFATFVAACTVLLILAGSFVTSTDSGLSVPDWPTTYGWNMFTFPPSKWVGGIFYEHGHRLIASTVGFLTIILAAWIWFADSRRWLRWFGVGALGVGRGAGDPRRTDGASSSCPRAVSTAHAGLAEIFFCMTVAIALFTSPGWIEGYGDARCGGSRTLRARRHDDDRRHLHADSRRRRRCGTPAPAWRFLTSRWMFGHVIPDHWSAAIAVHFAHRVGALIVIADGIRRRRCTSGGGTRTDPSWRGRRRSSCFSSSSR